MLSLRRNIWIYLCNEQANSYFCYEIIALLVQCVYNYINTFTKLKLLSKLLSPYCLIFLFLSYISYNCNNNNYYYKYDYNYILSAHLMIGLELIWALPVHISMALLIRRSSRVPLLTRGHFLALLLETFLVARRLMIMRCLSISSAIIFCCIKDLVQVEGALKIQVSSKKCLLILRMSLFQHLRIIITV